MERNNMSEEYFREHIAVMDVQLSSYQQAKTIRVSYEVTIDWATVKSADQFAYYIFQDASPFPALQIPKEQNLTQEEIAKTFEYHAWSANMTVINPINKLAYKSEKDALKALGENNQCSFKDGRVFFKMDRPFANEPANGTIYFESTCTINENDNKCLQGEIDLATGDKKVQDVVCWYN